MSHNHTLGPWEQGDDNKLNIYGGGRNVQGIYQSVALVHGVHATGSQSEIEALANARLIAAAPELLWIAERLVQIRRNSGNGYKGSVQKWTKEETDISLIDLEKLAQKAIAKVKGKINSLNAR